MKKSLYTIGEINKLRTYNFSSLSGEPAAKLLQFGDRVDKEARCPFDLARIVHNSGDPHIVSECPCCGNNYQRLLEASKNPDRFSSYSLKNSPLLANLMNNPYHAVRLSNLHDLVQDALDSPPKEEKGKLYKFLRERLSMMPPITG